MHPFGKDLRRMLDERNLTAPGAADLIGMETAQLNHYTSEKGGLPSLPTLARIANGLLLDNTEVAILVNSTLPPE